MKTETKAAMQVFEYLTGVRPEHCRAGSGSMKGFFQFTVMLDIPEVTRLKETFYVKDFEAGTFPHRKLGKLEIDYMHSTFPGNDGRMRLAVEVKASKLINAK